MITQEENKNGCGKPINGDNEYPDWFCGDSVDERINQETGEWEFLCYYCDECSKEKFTKSGSIQ